jgi:hypothetical protein
VNLLLPYSDSLLLVIAWCWIALPCFPSIAAWLRVHRQRYNERPVPLEIKLLLIILTNASYVWIVFALFFGTALLGPDYSSQRYSTIEANLVAMAVATLWALIRGRKFGWLPFCTALSTASVWFYLEIVNSAV